MKKIVTFGEIMLRLSPPGFLRFSQASQLDVVYGGGESNVAVSLARFGLPAEFVTRLPANDLGDCALRNCANRVSAPVISSGAASASGFISWKPGR